MTECGRRAGDVNPVIAIHRADQGTPSPARRNAAGFIHQQELMIFTDGVDSL